MHEDLPTTPPPGQTQVVYAQPPARLRCIAFLTFREGTLMVLVFLLIMLVTSTLAGAAYTLFQNPQSMTFEPDPLLIILIMLIANPLAAFVVAVWGWGRSRRGIRRTFGLRAAHWSVYPPIVLLGVALVVLMSELDNLIRLYIVDLPNTAAQALEPLGEYPVLGFVVLALMAPLTEEPIFRGLLLNNFMRRHGAAASLIVSALLFSLLHVNPVQTVPTFLLGLIFGWIFLRTRSVWPCIFAHAVYNGSGLLLVLSAEHSFTFAGEPELQPLWLDLAALAAAAVGASWFLLMTQKSPATPPDTPTT